MYNLLLLWDRLLLVTFMSKYYSGGKGHFIMLSTVSSGKMVWAGNVNEHQRDELQDHVMHTYFASSVNIWELNTHNCCCKQKCADSLNEDHYHNSRFSFLLFHVYTRTVLGICQAGAPWPGAESSYYPLPPHICEASFSAITEQNKEQTWTRTWSQQLPSWYQDWQRPKHGTGLWFVFYSTKNALP